MFCDRCGAAVQPDQRFCGRCGREFSGVVAIAYPSSNRVQEHVRLLGILWLALSALDAVVGFVACVLANTVFAHLHEMGAPPDTPAGFLQSLFGTIGGLILIKAAAGFLAGWGLLRREPWARMLTIVLSFLALFTIPLGTALGIYSLWVLLPAQSEREYEQVTRSVGAARGEQTTGRANGN
ncbi:MAG: zinc ribbon domain-containing protein [Candidatus Korobacteraceae bacterium]